MINVDRIRQIGSFRKYKIDEVICFEGETGKEMYIVLSGRADVYVNSIDNTLSKITEIEPGSFFGEMSILESVPRNATVMAGTDTIVAAIKKEDFLETLKEDPSLAYGIMKGLSSRLRNVDNELKMLKTQMRYFGVGDRLRSEAAAKAQIEKIDSRDELTGLDIFPNEHKHFDRNEPEEYRAFYYEKLIKCPICEKEFSAKHQRVSKLQLDRTENDLRKVYKGFEPMWYNIWVCPHCYYARYYTEFESINDTNYKAVKTKQKELQGKLNINQGNEFDINYVFYSYYLALFWTKICMDDPLKTAGYWMSLSWLYKDMEDNDMYKFAYEKAFTDYYDAYYNCNSINISAAQDQQLLILIGELFYRKGNTSEALNHFRNAIKNKNGVESLNKLARDRIHDIKVEKASDT